MAKKKRNIDQLKRQTKAVPAQKLQKVKGGYTQFTIPGRDFRAGTWTEIDLRIAPSNKKDQSFIQSL